VLTRVLVTTVNSNGFRPLFLLNSFLLSMVHVLLLISIRKIEFILTPSEGFNLCGDIGSIQGLFALVLIFASDMSLKDRS
jgi:hypothetical protein